MDIIFLSTNFYHSWSVDFKGPFLADFFLKIIKTSLTDWMVIFVIYSDDDLIRSGEEDSDGDDELIPSDEADDSDSNDGMSFFEEEETKSRFTNYSMTSSVLRRNEGM